MIAGEAAAVVEGERVAAVLEGERTAAWSRPTAVTLGRPVVGDVRSWDSGMRSCFF